MRLRLFAFSVVLIPGMSLLTSPTDLFAQDADAELWTGVELVKSITKDIRLSFEEEIRINDNISSVNSVFSQLSPSYKINKFLTFKAAYRYTQKPLDIGGFSIRHRFNTDLTFKYKEKPVIVYLRTRYQVGYKDLYSDYNKNNPSEYSRNRLKLKLDLDKAIEPYSSIEFFYQLGNPAGNAIDAFRYKLGLNYILNDKQELSLAYMLEKPLNEPFPITRHIWSLNYSFNLGGDKNSN